MTDDRLQSGMKASEALVRAELWWDGKGRNLIPREFNRQHERKVSRGIVIVGDVMDVVPSGILKGLPWLALDKREKLLITKWWHHWFVVVKDVENPTVSADDRDMMKRMGLQ